MREPISSGSEASEDTRLMMFGGKKLKARLLSATDARGAFLCLLAITYPCSLVPIKQALYTRNIANINLLTQSTNRVEESDQVLVE